MLVVEFRRLIVSSPSSAQPTPPPQRRMRIGEDGAGVAFGYAFDQVLQSADAAAGEPGILNASALV